MNKKFILLFGILIVFSLNVHAQFFSNDELEIIKFQDERTLGADNKLLSFLDSRNNEIVIKTLYALGNIGDTNNVIHISRFLLSGNSPQIRSAAAFALSLLNCNESRNTLNESIKFETSEDVLPAVLEAMGFIGTVEDFKTICEYKSDFLEVNTAKALSIGRFARRGIRNQDGINALINLFDNNPDSDLSRMISFALFNYRNRELIIPAKDIILKLTKSVNYVPRMWAFSALGYASEENDIKYLLGSYEKETEWQVKNNIINALNVVHKFNESVSKNTELADFLINVAEGEKVLLANTALNTLSNIFENTTGEVKQNIKERLQWFFILGKAIELETIGDAALAYSKIFKDEVKDDLIQMYRDSESYTLKSYYIQAFGNFTNAEVYKELRQLITDDIQQYVIKNKIENGEMIAGKELNQIYYSFVSALGKLKYKTTDYDKEIMRLIFSEFLSSKDPLIVDECLASLNDLMYKDKIQELKIILNIDYTDLQYPKDKEVMKIFLKEMGEIKSEESMTLLKKELNSSDYEIAMEAARSLEKITGTKFTFNAKPRSFFNADELNKLNGKTKISLNTTEGKIMIELFPKVAPLTVLNFIKLSETGFYNNTKFHRVVPNFVIQGGDPLNNGWGGSEYTIRSELSPLRFERGILGMASDGKDTEGSQFFIMHSPYYHLDRNYTIFGEVIEGMNVVDNIFINDYLQSVDINK